VNWIPVPRRRIAGSDVAISEQIKPSIEDAIGRLTARFRRGWESSGDLVCEMFASRGPQRPARSSRLKMRGKRPMRLGEIAAARRCACVRHQRR